MRHDPQKYLYDVCSACEFLLQFTAGRGGRLAAPRVGGRAGLLECRNRSDTENQRGSSPRSTIGSTPPWR
jgi:hypothetical protein